MESNGRRLGGLMHSWSDGMGLQPASSAPLLSFISTHGHDGSAEKKVMYKNLVEMFPLGDTLMVREAPLIIIIIIIIGIISILFVLPSFSMMDVYGCMIPI
jgi:hypothetical protein